MVSRNAVGVVAFAMVSLNLVRNYSDECEIIRAI